MQDRSVHFLNPILYDDLVRRALLEDLGRAGDVTTRSTVPAGTRATGEIVTRRAGCVAGIEVAAHAFRLLDSNVSVDVLLPDGAAAEPDQVVAVVSGSAQTLLEGERTSLNFLGHLSGIATATRNLVKMLDGLPTRLVCTRKTTPGLRLLEKYAVRVGGGFNHRFGLDDAVLIKENHVAVANSLPEAVRRARSAVGHMVKIEVEVENLDQLRQALDEDIDAVMLDNMSPGQVEEAVRIVGSRLTVEVSGGITPDRVVEYARAGADLISLGWLTHSAPRLDVAFNVRPILSA